MRRLTGIGLLTVVACTGVAPAAPAAVDDAAGSSAQAAMVALDQVYVPALFLTGSAGKDAEGPAMARAALARLQQRWPALRPRLQAAWAHDAGWRRTLDAVEADIAEAARHAAHAAWPASHEALEAVRPRLKQARQARGMDYLLDRYTSFHATMEQLLQMGTALTPSTWTPERQALMEALYARARAEWHAIERLPHDPAALGLSAARAQRLRQAMHDEREALTALSRALRGDDARQILPAARSIKPPFVRAYTAFGLDPHEDPGPSG